MLRSTKRRPVIVGRMLLTEFLEPMSIEISELADAMGVHRNTLSRIVHDRGALTAPMAVKLGAALGNTPEFWLNIQHAVEIWDVRHKAYEQAAQNVRRVRPRRACRGYVEVVRGATSPQIKNRLLLEISTNASAQQSDDG